MDYKLMLKVIAATLFVIVTITIFGLIELYSQLSRYQSYWTEQNKREYKTNELLYVALGDSTAQGIGAGSADKGYVGLIAKELEKKNPSTPVRTVNLSKSGAKVSDALTMQVPELKKLPITESTVITIEIGANNMINFDSQKFESEMDQLMAELPKQTLISDMPYFGETRYKSRQVNVEKANEIMYRLADKHDFELVPLHEKMKSNGGVKTFAFDWFHPSSTAYRENWAPVFLSRIN